MDRTFVIFWGIFSSKGRLNLVECEIRMNSDKYIELAKNNVIPFIGDKYDNLYLFQ